MKQTTIRNKLVRLDQGNLWEQQAVERAYTLCLTSEINHFSTLLRHSKTKQFLFCKYTGEKIYLNHWMSMRK